MRHVKPRESFLKYLYGQKEFSMPDRDQSEDQCRQLLELTKQYRKEEEAYYNKLKFNLPAFNEKSRLMETQKKLDFILHTFTI